MIKIIKEGFEFKVSNPAGKIYYSNLYFKYDKYTYHIGIELWSTDIEPPADYEYVVLFSLMNEDTGDMVDLDISWEIENKESKKSFEKFYKELISDIESCSTSMELAEYLIKSQGKFENVLKQVYTDPDDEFFKQFKEK